MVINVDEKELDIPNGENNAENEEEQEQPEVEEQEFYVEGWFYHREKFPSFDVKCVFVSVACRFLFCYQYRIKTSWR